MLSTGSSEPPTDGVPKKETAEHLKNLSSKLVQSLNDRTFPSLAPTLMLRDYSGQHLMDDTSWSVTDVDSIVKLMSDFLAANPNFHTDIIDMNVRVDMIAGAGSVWVRRTDMGLAEGPRQETVMEFLWVRIKGEWFCSGYQGMRSFPFYGGDGGEL